MLGAMGRPDDERAAALRWVTALWLLAIVALSATASLQPYLLLHWTRYLPGRDKTGHFLLMGGFAAVSVLGFAGRRLGARTISAWTVLLAVTLIVVSEEGLQRWLPSRTLSLVDLAYSLAGVYICGALACAWRAYRRPQDP
jgi:VanZ family protein